MSKEDYEIKKAVFFRFEYKKYTRQCRHSQDLEMAAIKRAVALFYFLALSNFRWFSNNFRSTKKVIKPETAPYSHFSDIQFW